jgi:5-methylthioadenosine/S-adenosylhomocysteine deaminase
MKLSSGVSPVAELLRKGVCVSMGTDGSASNNNMDLLEEIKIGSLLQKVTTMDPTVLTAEKVFKMVTIDGAESLGLEKQIGSIEVDKKADLALVDMRTPQLTPFRNPISHLVYSANGGNVDTVICNGEILMENRELLKLDEAMILEIAKNASEELLSKS